MKSAKAGAVWGAVSWLVYAALEILFLTLQPMVRGHTDAIPPWHWKLVAVATLTYALIGLVSGFAVGFLARGLNPVAWRAGGPLALALGFLLTLVCNLDAGAATYLPAAVTLAVAALILTGVRADGDGWLQRAVTDPVIVPVLLIGVAWAADLWRLSGFMVSAAGAVISLVAIGGLLALRDKLLEPGSEYPWRHAAIGILIFVAAIGGSMALSEGRPDTQLAAKGSAASGSPNIIFISLDTVRADHLSTYGYERKTAPELSRFAAGATLYRNAIATSNHTLPTHSSVFTGLHPRTHGAHNEPPRGDQLRPLDAAFRTAAETLAQNGYVTGAVAGNWAMLGKAMGVMQGFEYLYAVRPAPFTGNALARSCLRQGLAVLLQPFLNTLEFDRQFYKAEKINVEVDSLLDQAAGASPFFLFANYMDAHAPYLPPEPFTDRYPGRANLSYRRYLNMVNPILSGEETLTGRDHDHLISQYDGALAYLDSQLRPLLDSLRDRGLYDDSLIIMMGDHGESMGEKRFIGHGLTVFQNQVHVPLLIKYPGQREGKVIDEVVSQVDLLPTLLAAAGIETNQKLPGRNLNRPIETDGFRAISSEFRIDLYHQLHSKFGLLNRSIVADGFKLIAYADGSTELYDLTADPDEEHDLSRQQAELAQRLAGEISQWAEQTPRYASIGSSNADPAQLERLKALGYVQ